MYLVLKFTMRKVGVWIENCLAKYELLSIGTYLTIKELFYHLVSIFNSIL